MANIAFTRIQRECREVATNKEIAETGVMIEILNERLSKIKGEVRGPPDTPYADGIFQLDIEIPDQYPFQPPKMKFITKVWHPNVSSQTGAINVDVLKDQWAASLTLRTLLISIQGLLGTPEPTEALDRVVGRQCLDRPALFQETAEFWTQHYARKKGVKNTYFLACIQELMKKGVSENTAISVLSCRNWNLSEATRYISL